jgi:hypothetical protein
MPTRCTRGRATSTTALAVIALMGCSPAPGGDARPTDTGFAYAYYHDDCAPWDGHALTFALTGAEMETPFDVAYPQARISLWRPPVQLAGRSVSWSGIDHDDGYAAVCETEEACGTATRLEIRFARDQDRPDVLVGEIYMELDDGRVVGGPFQARRIEHAMLCG